MLNKVIRCGYLRKITAYSLLCYGKMITRSAPERIETPLQNSLKAIESNQPQVFFV